MTEAEQTNEDSSHENSIKSLSDSFTDSYDLLDEYNKIIQEAYDYINEIRPKLVEAIIQCLQALPEPERQERANILYWNHQRMSSVVRDAWKHITKTTFVPTPIASEHECKYCHFVFTAKSWSSRIELTKKAIKYDLVCSDCAAKRAKTEQEQKEIERLREIQLLKELPYDQYLLTDHWKMVREAILHKSKYTCQKCGKTNVPLHVHHLNYDHLGEEWWSDLISVCELCHKQIHHIAKEANQ